MADATIDAKGLSCPQPVLKISSKAPEMDDGEMLEVQADCSTFPDDVEQWCEKTGNVLVSCNTSGEVHTAQIKF